MMKDKLVKNGHKGIYYNVRRAFLAGIISTSLFAVVGIPTYTVVKHNLNNQTLAKEKEPDTQEDEEFYDLQTYIEP